MAKQTINVGSGANSGNGEPLRDALVKCVNNFNEVYGASDTPSSLTALDTDMTAVEGSVSTLEGSVSTLEGTVNTLSNDVITVEGNLTSLETQVTTLEGNVVTLSSDLTTVEGNLDSLDTQVTTLEGTVSGHTSSIALTATREGVNKQLAVTITGSNVVLTAPQTKDYSVFNLSGAITGSSKTLSLNATEEKFCTIKNLCTGGYNVTIRVEGVTGQTVVTRYGDIVVVQSDKTNITLLSSNAYHIGGGSNTIPTSEQVMLRWKFPVNVLFAGNFHGSSGCVDAGSEAGEYPMYDVTKNGESIGNITYNLGSTATPDFETTSGLPVTFLAGDIIRVIAPTVPDSSHANFSFTLAGSKVSAA